MLSSNATIRARQIAVRQVVREVMLSPEFLAATANSDGRSIGGVIRRIVMGWAKLAIDSNGVKLNNRQHWLPLARAVAIPWTTFYKNIDEAAWRAVRVSSEFYDVDQNPTSALANGWQPVEVADAGFPMVTDMEVLAFLGIPTDTQPYSPNPNPQVTLGDDVDLGTIRRGRATYHELAATGGTAPYTYTMREQSATWSRIVQGNRVYINPDHQTSDTTYTATIEVFDSAIPPTLDTMEITATIAPAG